MTSKCTKKSRSVLVLTTDRQIDRRTLQQADSLEAAGWAVTILAMPLDEPNEQDDPRVIRINATPQKKQELKNFFILFLYRMIRRYLPMNGRVMRIMKRFAWTYFVNQETFYLKLFATDLSRYSPHVVVAVDLPMLPAATEAARQCGAKLVYDSHELYCEQEFSKHEKRRWRSIEAKYIQRCDAVITVNPSIAALLERSYDINPVNVIYNAVSCSHHPRKTHFFHTAFGLPLERKILLFQGGLTQGRHLETLIVAMRYVQNPMIDLVILGDGQLSHTLEQIATVNGLKNRVYFHPAVSQAALLDYTQSADAGLIPYQATCLNNYYCTPNKLFEFLAAGIPILANDLPELRNIVTSNSIGLTGTMSTAEELAKLMDDFFSDESRLSLWKDKLLTVRKQFCWSHEEKKLIQIFEDI